MTAFEIAQLELMRAERILGTIEAVRGQLALSSEYLVQSTSLLFGYIIAAYFAGAKLTRRQLIVLNTLYIFFELILFWSILLSSIYAYELQGDLLRLRGLPPINPLIMKGFAWGVFLGQVLSLTASLYFMWTIRNAQKD